MFHLRLVDFTSSHYHFQLWISGSSFEHPIRSKTEFSPQQAPPRVIFLHHLPHHLSCHWYFFLIMLSNGPGECHRPGNNEGYQRGQSSSGNGDRGRGRGRGGSRGRGNWPIIDRASIPRGIYAIFIGPMDPAIATLTARTSTRQGPKCLLPHTGLYPRLFLVRGVSREQWLSFRRTTHS